MGDSRPTAFLGYPRGHRIDSETRCQTAAHRAPNERFDTLPRTRASHEPMGHHRGRKTWEITWVLFHAQAACVFSCSASKRSPFFQSVNVMAAILRASVRRAISGFIPLASKAADSETRCQTAAHRAPNEPFDTLPRTRASHEPMGHHRGRKNKENNWKML